MPESGSDDVSASRGVLKAFCTDHDIEQFAEIQVAGIGNDVNRRMWFDVDDDVTAVREQALGGPVDVTATEVEHITLQAVLGDSVSDISESLTVQRGHPLEVM